MKNMSLRFILIFGIIFGSLLFTSFVLDNNSTSELRPETLSDIESPDENALMMNTEVTENYFTDSGNNLDASLYANISKTASLNSPYLEVPGYKYYDLSINTNHQNITQTNLSISNIEAGNATYVLEDNPEYFITTVMAPGLYIGAAMSIKIPTACKLKQIQLFLQELDYITPPLWNITVFNATRNLDEDLLVLPHQKTSISVLQPATNILTGPAAHWQNFTFPDVQLNMTNTYVDANGFAYYFFVIAMPPNTTALDHRFLYLSFDRSIIDGGYAYIGVQAGASIDYNYYDVDICLRVLLAPLSNTPDPSDIGLAIKNSRRAPLTSLIYETNHSIPIHAAHDETTYSIILAQNFTITDYATISDISLYLKSYGDTVLTMVGIFPKNNTGIGPKWDGNLLYDLNITINILDNSEGWFNFTMFDKPNLAPGEYWWVLICQTTGNLTLYGTKDPPSYNEMALNITAYIVGQQTFFNTSVVDGHFASIIYYQPGKEYFLIENDWINDSRFIPDQLGFHHFSIITRWLGATSFDVTYTVELEKNQQISSIYYAIYNQSVIAWDIRINPAFPSTSLGNIINLTLPLDWMVFNVTKNSIDYSNWNLNVLSNNQILSIHNASEDIWRVICISPIYSTEFKIEKDVQGQFTLAENATIYDQIQINTTIYNQTNGVCYLTILYPNGRSSFKNQTQITSETAIFTFRPGLDPDTSGGNYTFIIYWSNGTEIGWDIQYLYFTPIPANITILSAIPTPYINDLSKSILIRYNDSRGVNLTGATVYATLGGNIVNWEDIYQLSLNPNDKGKYRIKLNTTGLNNQIYYLNGWVEKEGYKNVTISPIQVQVLPVPTSLNPNMPNITQYQNEPISFSCSFKDTFHGTGIDWAYINYTIIGTDISGSLANIMPGESVYTVENVELKDLFDHGTPYQINLTAIANNCQSASLLIDLFVKNKTPTILSIVDVSGSHIQGRSMRIRARLQNALTNDGIPNATIRFSFAGVIQERIALTDQDGYAEIEISVPANSFTISAFFDETTSIAEATPYQTDVNVIKYSDIALWLGIIIGVIFVSVLLVRQFYIVPKRNRREKAYQKISQKFSDVANLRQLLILHKVSSGCLYQESIGGQIDGDLISGFLSAISSFQGELKTDKVPYKEVKASGFELNYEDYKIIVFPGEYINIALIFDEVPSNEFRLTVQNLVREYEARYKEYLVNFRGDVTPFKDSSDFIADKIELNLSWPHQLHRPSVSTKLSALEEGLIQIADTVMKSQVQNYFFLPSIISIAHASGTKSKFEIIANVYELRKRTIFRPISLNAIA